MFGKFVLGLCIGGTARHCRTAFNTPPPLHTTPCPNIETERRQDRMMKQATRPDSGQTDMIAKGAPRWTSERAAFDSMLSRDKPRHIVVVADGMLQQTSGRTLLRGRDADDYH
ncbi:hypothetical protein [Rhodovulum marinum]|uniref:Uncharacterized protein n=1 Tax=Rhodovulum marinum TaxID=320662 RepID=A0A4R2Q8M6_9RHOB|nr:hypothetical protein [Rhodovulum marinum]TCP44444.1 hypothetical protein EV662_101538 [Rhodovulum marinum]